ncbi:MAG TPA: aminotransferase class I/II-fold pyridoxal phosphate-dependent enzyme [Propionicimonas sp.]|uniref:pyridoxal phosphate-dependent aminotransferase n=1 Tax=Propionicimonas sp. TaxID=1955623 RepID=UPI002F3F5543
MKLSQRGRVEPFHVMEVAKAAAARQRSHGDAILLCVGQPATPAPAAVRAAAVAAVTEEVLGYTVTSGIPELRGKIAAEYAARYGIPVDAEEVVITTGSSAGFQLTILAAFEVGDRVAMTRPGYPAYRNTLHALGCEVVDLDVGPNSRYQPTVAMLEALPRVPAGLVLASPSNPTGTIIDGGELAELAAWCAANDCLLISDEIYHGISFGRPCTSAREFGPDAVVVGSVSKYHSMTGWRLGWLLLPPALRRPVELLQGNLAICAPAVSQAAALAAFTPDAATELDAHVARYARNRELLLRRLPELGITTFAPPDGAFYAWCDIGHLTSDSLAWCADVLAATGVALAPGIDFDLAGGGRMMRLSFCGSTGELSEALDRLARHLA